MSPSGLDVVVVHSDDALRRQFRAWLETTYSVSTYRVPEFLARGPDGVEADVLELEWAIGSAARRAALSTVAAAPDADGSPGTDGGPDGVGTGTDGADWSDRPAASDGAGTGGTGTDGADGTGDGADDPGALTRASVLAILDGVPDDDPLRAGADHDVAPPFDRGRVRLATDVLALQRGYRAAVDRYYDALRASIGPDPDAGDGAGRGDGTVHHAGDRTVEGSGTGARTADPPDAGVRDGGDAGPRAVGRRADGELDALADHLSYPELFRRLFDDG